MERTSAAALPPGYGYEWTGTALQEKEASGKTTIILALAVLFAYLFLVGLYESWTIPIAGAALGHGRRHGCDAGVEDGRGSTTISMPRSASWC